MFRMGLFIIMVMLLGACSNEGEPSAEAAPSVEKLADQELSSESEIQQGDFVLRLVSKKKSYGSDEKVLMTAMLKYVGDKSEETIYHAMYPLAFGVTETTRGIDMGTEMEQPLLTTVMKRGEWVTREYAKSGGYDTYDTSDRTVFVKRFLAGDGFPKGVYRVNGIADFFTKAGEDESKYLLMTDITIAVD